MIGEDAARHLPVMLAEALEIFDPLGGGVYLDATVGLGGHALGLLGLAGDGGLVIGLDRDEAALSETAGRIGDARLRLMRARFSEIEGSLRDMGISKIDGALFDFGVSMMQLKDSGRGFGFDSEAPLDMRMGRAEGGPTAADVVNSYDETELARVIYEYGEERRSRAVARAIVRARGRGPIRTCRELGAIVAGAVGGGRGRTHPATRTFQAIRIEVNSELQEIRAGLDGVVGMLRPGGRMVAISYHSLEDRIVKHGLREMERGGRVRVITKKPLRPGDDEVRVNRASRSARLRAAEAVGYADEG